MSVLDNMYYSGIGFNTRSLDSVSFINFLFRNFYVRDIQFSYNGGEKYIRRPEHAFAATALIRAVPFFRSTRVATCTTRKLPCRNRTRLKRIPYTSWPKNKHKQRMLYWLRRSTSTRCFAELPAPGRTRLCRACGYRSWPSRRETPAELFKAAARERSQQCIASRATFEGPWFRQGD